MSIFGRRRTRFAVGRSSAGDSDGANPICCRAKRKAVECGRARRVRSMATDKVFHQRALSQRWTTLQSKRSAGERFKSAFNR